MLAHSQLHVPVCAVVCAVVCARGDHKEAEVFVAVVKSWRDGEDRGLTVCVCVCVCVCVFVLVTLLCKPSNSLLMSSRPCLQKHTRTRTHTPLSLAENVLSSGDLRSSVRPRACCTHTLTHTHRHTHTYSVSLRTEAH
jgi:hypothetical protein